MKNRVIFWINAALMAAFLFVLLFFPLFLKAAVDAPIQVRASGDALHNLLDSVAVGTGKTLTFRSGSTLDILSGATVNFSPGTISWASVNKAGSSLADLATRSAADLSSGTLLAARMPALTGDASSTAGTVALTFATVNSNVGTFASVTVNGKGLVTAATALSGDLTTSGALATLATVATGATTGGSTAIPVITFNNKGLVTGVTTAVVVAPAGTLSGTTLAATVVTSSLTSVGTLTGGATGAGFTVNLGTSTLSGNVPIANLAGGTGASSSTFLRGDNSWVAVGTVTSSGTPTSGQLASWTSASNIQGVTTGTGVLTALGVNTGSAGAFVVNGGALGTPASGVGTNLTGTAASLTAGNATKWTTGRTISITGDLAYTSAALDGAGNVTAVGTLATVNSNVGAFGSATQVGTFTVNAKGLVTAAANVTVTPAVASITGLGTNVATALAVNVGTSGAIVVNGGVLGTPSSGVATNLTGLPTSGLLDAAVTLAKMANLAQDQFIGRTTASTGVPQTTTITASARTVLDDTSVGAMVNTLGGATSSGTGGLARITGASLINVTLTNPTLGAAGATSIYLDDTGGNATSIGQGFIGIQNTAVSSSSQSFTLANIAAGGGIYALIQGDATAFRIGVDDDSGTESGQASAPYMKVNGTNLLRFDPSTGLAYFPSSIRVPSAAPTLANDTGVAGTITWSSGFLYVCTATNTWKRVAIATW